MVRMPGRGVHCTGRQTSHQRTVKDRASGLHWQAEKLPEGCQGRGIRLALHWHTLKLSLGGQRCDDMLGSLTKAFDRSRSRSRGSSLLRRPGCHNTYRNKQQATLCHKKSSCKAHLAHDVICAIEQLWQGLKSPPK